MARRTEALRLRSRRCRRFLREGGAHIAARIVTIEIHDTTLRVFDDHNELVTTVLHTSTKEVERHKAHGKRTPA